jgi:hypothetical protein
MSPRKKNDSLKSVSNIFLVEKGGKSDMDRLTKMFRYTISMLVENHERTPKIFDLRTDLQNRF